MRTKRRGLGRCVPPQHAGPLPGLALATSGDDPGDVGHGSAMSSQDSVKVVIGCYWFVYACVFDLVQWSLPIFTAK